MENTKIPTFDSDEGGVWARDGKWVKGGVQAKGKRGLSAKSDCQERGVWVKCREYSLMWRSTGKLESTSN